VFWMILMNLLNGKDIGFEGLSIEDGKEPSDDPGLPMPDICKLYPSQCQNAYAIAADAQVDRQVDALREAGASVEQVTNFKAAALQKMAAELNYLEALLQIKF